MLMRVVSAAEMRELDRLAIEDYGISGVVLMENAGLKVVEVARQMLGDVRGRVISVFAGKGNNGGDGFVVARHLFNMGCRVRVFLLAKTEEIAGDAGVNLSIWEKMSQPVYTVGRDDQLDELCSFLAGSDLIIDAIFGTGFKGLPGQPAAGVIQAINDSKKPVLAVDIPSGLEADSGLVGGPCVRAAQTVTFGLPKLGLVQQPGAGYVGRLHVADISIPSFLLKAEHLKRHLLTPEMVSNWLVPRPANFHKGDCGRVLIIAGSRGMTGAACLVAEGAARAGAGLVTLAVPAGLQEVVAGKLTEVMTVALPATSSQTISRNALNDILTLAEHADVVALGPGITTHPETAALVRELLPALRAGCVLDADGLNCLVNHLDIFQYTLAPLVLTPHPGEMGRLIGKTTAEVQKQRLFLTEQAAQAWGAVVLLKGAATIVASPGGTAYINTTGNPGMATGGSGDVLTGVIAGLLGQGLGALEAAAAGAYLHGLAGDYAARQKSCRALLAGDILACLPEALKETEG